MQRSADHASVRVEIERDRLPDGGICPAKHLKDGPVLVNFGERFQESLRMLLLVAAHARQLDPTRGGAD
jgi:hypothetical protein